MTKVAFLLWDIQIKEYWYNGEVAGVCTLDTNDQLEEKSKKLAIIKRQHFQIVRYHLNVCFRRNCERRDVWWFSYHRNDTTAHSLEPQSKFNVLFNRYTLNEFEWGCESHLTWGVKDFEKNETVSFCVCTTFTTYHLNTATTWQKSTILICWITPNQLLDYRFTISANNSYSELSIF